MPEGNEGYISELDIRMWLRDNDPAANLLLDDYEFTPEEVRTAMTMTVDFWNEAPPSLTGAHYSIDTFPFRFHYIMGVSGMLLMIAAHRYRRNRMPSQISGGTVDDQNKHQEYEAAGGRLWDMFKGWAMRKKVEINMDRGWSHI